MKTRRNVLFMALSVALTACASQPGPKLPGDPWRQSQLYFGLSKPDGSVVTDPEFVGFVSTHITPAFPDGLTLQPAIGQYKNARGEVTREPSRLLTIVYPLGQLRSASDRLNAIAHAYCAKFHQESVLRVDSDARVSFPN